MAREVYEASGSPETIVETVNNFMSQPEQLGREPIGITYGLGKDGEVIFFFNLKPKSGTKKYQFHMAKDKAENLKATAAKERATFFINGIQYYFGRMK